MIVLPGGGNFDLMDDTPAEKAKETEGKKKDADALPSVEAAKAAVERAWQAVEKEIASLRENVKRLEAQNASYKRQLESAKALARQLGSTLD